MPQKAVPRLRGARSSRRIGTLLKSGYDVSIVDLDNGGQAVFKKKTKGVLGSIDPSKAGITHTHEHLSMLFDFMYTPPTAPWIEPIVSAPLTMDKLGLVRQFPFSSKANLRLCDEQDAVLEELKFFKSNGGCTIVENSSIGLSRDAKYFKHASETTGINIVMGTGYYVDASLTDSIRSQTVEQMAEMMKADILTGCDGTDIKSGVIGEIGCTYPLQDSERKALQAGAHVQRELGCPLIIHPGRNPKAPFEIARIVQEAGGITDKTVMSHLDRTISDNGTLLEFAALGMVCEWDLFGIETSFYQLGDIDMPSDVQRIQFIKLLIDSGYGEKVVIAHDIHSQHRLMKFGGHGYSHILLTVVPKMLQRGITKDAIDKILIDNPRTWLTFK